ncbi:methyltransferase domain-containing protein [Nocardioides sp. MAH-18]|uniref:Methyltransferase domain-containing protein n=1 Tax=Nocardioides agri TaxID=2682843 RepID=A0A6L6XQD9_9ACTN|nr:MULTISPECIES: class I SAM-dependent methyltransferase [unclassified Nocardioides]MBA2954653.1 class I SAM-dependent methyltransferase [Nocardioides sp. CGMCC 1.13656]MVQ49509.1 methyltransferase domain-containing protein [Nocardioides sp. MAH-18]
MSHEHQHQQEITREHFEQPSWDERYGGEGRTWSGRPNAVLVAEASDLPVGRAVDLGCGEGGDAIWLAERGWEVTGIDFSEAGLRKAAEHAAQRGVADRITWVQADLRTWTPDGEQWDLVTSCFLHLLDHGMVEATRRMADAVAPGGTLLVAGHHPDDSHTGLRWSLPGVMFTADELAPAVDPDLFDVRAEARRRTETRNDETHEVTDAVLLAVRK